MFKVVSNNITITRGDSGTLNIRIEDPAGNDYIMREGDKAVLTVKRSTADKDALFQLPIVDGVAKIRPENTNTLDYGTYVYDCQLTTADGDVYTFISPHQFKVAEEVTF